MRLRRIQHYTDINQGPLRARSRAPLRPRSAATVTPTSKVNRKINRKQLRNRSRTCAIPGGTHEHINMNTLTANLITPPQTVETAILPHNAVGIDHSRAENAIKEFQVKLLRSGRPTNPQSPPPARGRKSKGALPSSPGNARPLKAQLLRVPVASLGASAAHNSIVPNIMLRGNNANRSRICNHLGPRGRDKRTEQKSHGHQEGHGHQSGSSHLTPYQQLFFSSMPMGTPGTTIRWSSHQTITERHPAK